MANLNHFFKAIFSSDWNECLAPCGPFDVIAFHYPEMSAALDRIFKQYTGNAIPLGDAVQAIHTALPAPITQEQVDTYLENDFKTYKGVPELIQWCHDQKILFMINTTGMIGYFQRVFAMGLLPPVPVLSAHPAIRFDRDKKSLMHILDLHETLDKGLNTHRAIQAFHVPPSKIIIMGDSGGDGPHFKWGQDHGAYLIGSMIKPSLMKYCQDNTLTIDHLFGIHYREGDEIDRHLEMQADFMALAPAIEALLQQL